MAAEADGKSLFGDMDRRLEEPRPGQFSVALMQGLPAGDRPRRGQGQWPACGHQTGTIERRAQGGVAEKQRRPPTGVQTVQSLSCRIPHHGKEIATRAAHLGFGHRKHRVGGDRRIHRAASCAQQFDAGEARERLAARHHAASSDRRWTVLWMTCRRGHG